MAFADALPDPREWSRQLQDGEGTPLQDASAYILTIGSIAMTLIMLAAVAAFFGFEGGLTQSIFGFELPVPFIGEAKLLPAFAFAGGVVAVPYTLRVEAVAGDREILKDDANWIILTSGVSYILAAVRSDLSVSPTIRFAVLLIGLAFGGVYVTRVVGNR